jgi:hypothetical protein
MQGTLHSKDLQELAKRINREPCLFDDGGKSLGLEVARMGWNRDTYAAALGMPQDVVTSAHPRDNEPRAFQGAYNVSSGRSWESREGHVDNLFDRCVDVFNRSRVQGGTA